MQTIIILWCVTMLQETTSTTKWRKMKSYANWLMNSTEMFVYRNNQHFKETGRILVVTALQGWNYFEQCLQTIKTNVFSFMVKPVCHSASHLFYRCTSISVYALQIHVFQLHNKYIWGKEGQTTGKHVATNIL